MQMSAHATTWQRCRSKRSKRSKRPNATGYLFLFFSPKSPYSAVKNGECKINPGCSRDSRRFLNFRGASRTFPKFLGGCFRHFLRHSPKEKKISQNRLKLYEMLSITQQFHKNRPAARNGLRMATNLIRIPGHSSE